MSRHIQALLRHIEPDSDRFRTLCNRCIYNRVIFRTLTHLEPEAFPKTCRTCKMTRHIQSLVTVRKLCKHFEGYLGIFRNIDAYSSTLTSARRATIFTLCIFLHIFFTKSLSKCLRSMKSPPPWKLMAARLHSDTILLAKRSILNVWQCCEYTSVSITAQEFVQYPYCYRLHQKHSEFLTYSELYLFRYIQTYPRIFSIIQVYSRLLKHY